MLNSFLLKSKSKLKNFVKKGNYISVAKTLLDSSVKKGDLILDIGPGECELLHYLSENFGDTVTLHA